MTIPPARTETMRNDTPGTVTVLDMGEIRHIAPGETITHAAGAVPQIMPPSAFWLRPDWSGGDPFWMRDQVECVAPRVRPASIRSVVFGTSRIDGVTHFYTRSDGTRVRVCS